MQKPLTIKTIYFFLASLIFSYVALRAFTVGITYDEAWTLHDFIPHDWIHILNFTPCDANNHLLNTLLIKTLYLIDPYQSLIVARLPNVLAFGLYLYFSYKICHEFKNQIIGIGIFLLLILNPFLLDFFSLARGYGLSFGFLIPSIYFLLKTISVPFEDLKKSRYSIYSLIFASLSVLSNFSILNYWLVLFCFLIFYHLFYWSKLKNKKAILYLFINAICLLAIIYEPIRKLKKQGNLYYGGTSDFYHDTLVSLAKYTFYSTTLDSFILISLNIFIIIFCSILVVSFIKKQKWFSEKNILLLILTLTILSTIVQFILLDTLYLIDRTALFLYPMIILVLGASLQTINLKRITQTLVISLVFGFTLNFVKVANFSKTATWYFDSHSEEILDQLNSLAVKENKKFEIDYSWPFQSSLGYYFRKNNYSNIRLTKKKYERKKIHREADFFIQLLHPIEKVGFNVSFENKGQNKLYKEFKTENIKIWRK